MNKIPKFMGEYAQYVKKCIYNDRIVLDADKRDKIKKEAIRRVDKVLDHYKCGYITIREAMKLLNDI